MTIRLIMLKCRPSVYQKYCPTTRLIRWALRRVREFNSDDIEQVRLRAGLEQVHRILL